MVISPTSFELRGAQLVTLRETELRVGSLQYIFELLAVLYQVMNTGADLQHLWHGRARTRTRMELMAAIWGKIF